MTGFHRTIHSSNRNCNRGIARHTLATLVRPLTRVILSQPAPLQRVCAWRGWVGEIDQNLLKSVSLEFRLSGTNMPAYFQRPENALKRANGE